MLSSCSVKVMMGRKILTSNRCLAPFQGPEGFFCRRGEKHTYTVKVT
jgi:hypothetical protein